MKRLNLKITLMLTLTYGLSISIANAADKKKTPLSDKHVLYKETPQGKLWLHVFYPDELGTTERRGAIVFFFGGGWNGGSPKQFYHHSKQLSDLGMIAICAEYRVKSKHKTSPFICVEDAKSAIRFVRQYAADLSVDPNHIAAAGGSAGGHLAICTAMIEKYDIEKLSPKCASSIPNAVIAFNPVVDTTKRILKKRLGKKCREISPIHHIKKGQVPMLIFHGTADKIVPFKSVQLFEKLMKKKGNDCKLVPFKDMKHGFFNYGRNKNKPYIETMKQTEQFLKKHGFIQGPKK